MYVSGATIGKKDGKKENRQPETLLILRALRRGFFVSCVVAAGTILHFTALFAIQVTIIRITRAATGDSVLSAPFCNLFNNPAI